jgi:hypothetical protein
MGVPSLCFCDRCGACVLFMMGCTHPTELRFPG